MSVEEGPQARWFTSHVRLMMSEILERPVQIDADGDVEVDGVTSRGWVRADTQSPCSVQVVAYAAQGVPDRVAVLREINQLNAHYYGVKVTWLPGGLIAVDDTLQGDAVTADSLGACIAGVLTVADRIGPVLTTVHGGETPLPLQPTVHDT